MSHATLVVQLNSEREKKKYGADEKCQYWKAL